MPRSFAARVNWLMRRHSRQLRADESGCLRYLAAAQSGVWVFEKSWHICHGSYFHERLVLTALSQWKPGSKSSALGCRNRNCRGGHIDRLRKETAAKIAARQSCTVGNVVLGTQSPAPGNKVGAGFFARHDRSNPIRLAPIDNRSRDSRLHCHLDGFQL